ncbi:hypothetical protein EZV62_024325 [Acer yangbiense]|uniref:Uncharacterized protein n=1 Tax=Acer yangbiense TaxID=1000413 RepID=A0A5C7H4D9_9ROSI|nr:hypothetical protein EZV62_024325 [Acer yangbiense]
MIADVAPDLVLDIFGKKLQADIDYYILPVERGRGSGLTLASTANETCPLDVIQEQHEVENGLPLTISPVNIKKGDWFVTTEGVEGNPSRETVSNWFKIEKFDGDYKLLFCPIVFDIYRVVCKDIRIYIDQADFMFKNLIYSLSLSLSQNEICDLQFVSSISSTSISSLPHHFGSSTETETHFVDLVLWSLLSLEVDLEPNNLLEYMNMDTKRLVIYHGGSWVGNCYEGGLTKWVNVPRGLTYDALVKLVQDVAKVDAARYTIELCSLVSRRILGTS